MTIYWHYADKMADTEGDALSFPVDRKHGYGNQNDFPSEGISILVLHASD
jgi:quercetin dioxygenase-like cupin family protein